MEIKLGIGLDNIVFGSTESGVEDILGKPDKVILDNEYEENETIFQFNSIKSRLTFYNNHGGKLGYIRSSNPDLHYKNNKLIGIPISEAFEIFDEVPKESWQITEYDFWTEYFYEDCWIVLKCNYSEVSEIELGVPFKNKDEYSWPK